MLKYPLEINNYNAKEINQKVSNYLKQREKLKDIFNFEAAEEHIGVNV